MSTILTEAALLDPVLGRWTPNHELLDLESTAKVVGSLAMTQEQQDNYEFFAREWSDVAFGD